MDVRSADTSTQAAKRLELEHVQPVKEKRGFMQDQMEARAAEEAKDRANRPKPPKDSLSEQGSEYPGGQQAEEQSAAAAEQDSDVSEPPASGEQHILDVKV